MGKPSLIILVFSTITLTVSSAVYAEPKINYVGDGRYACRGSQTECAQTNQQNEQREERRRTEIQHRKLLDESRTQTRLLEEQNRLIREQKTSNQGLKNG